MERSEFEVVVIGAGASGLMAAWELALAGKKTAIIEARNRSGGRIHTLDLPGFDGPIEAGAEFVHGKLKLTQSLIERSGSVSYKVKGDIWQKKEGRIDEQKDFIEDYPLLEKKFSELNSDIPVQDFLAKYLQDDKFEELRFSLKNYVEGYYAGDTSKASTMALKKELSESGNDQYRLEHGYSVLIDYLSHQCQLKGVELYLSHEVNQVNWQKDHISLQGRDFEFKAKKAVITVPVSILQEERISFIPALADKIEAVKKLGYGPVIKTILQFSHPFWKEKQTTQGKDLSSMGFIFTEALIPTWWTFYPKKTAILTGWSGGPHAIRLKGSSNDEILEKALRSLAEIFDITFNELQNQLKAWYVSNWPADHFGCYGYSYQVVNGEAWQTIIRKPVEQTLYFAGEGLHSGPEIGTVEAALLTGREAAHNLIAGN